MAAAKGDFPRGQVGLVTCPTCDAPVRPNGICQRGHAAKRLQEATLHQLEREGLIGARELREDWGRWDAERRGGVGGLAAHLAGMRAGRSVTLRGSGVRVESLGQGFRVHDPTPGGRPEQFGEAAQKQKVWMHSDTGHQFYGGDKVHMPGSPSGVGTLTGLVQHADGVKARVEAPHGTFDVEPDSLRPADPGIAAEQAAASRALAVHRQVLARNQDMEMVRQVGDSV